MEQNERNEEIVTTEEVNEVGFIEVSAEEQEDNGISTGLVVGGGVLLGIGVKILYDKFAKPKVNKWRANKKAKKAAKENEPKVDIVDDDFDDEFDNEN
jgi:hypothetical protein